MSADARRHLLGIVAVAVALRALLMALRGDYVMYDEGYYLLLARNLAAGNGFTLAGLPHVALSPLQPIVVAALSLLGLSPLAASRLVAVVAGALLAVPVAAIGRRLGGDRVGLAAGALATATSTLMTFLPFFPGRSWNLYFGSEPLFLAVAFGAVALAMRAAEDGGWLAWVGAGALAAAAYLVRAEGLVLAPLLFGVAAARLLARRAPAPAWRGWAIAVLVGALCSAPYLVYLRDTLGRWALSGRVQAAVLADAPRDARAATAVARSGGAIVEDFLWRGDQEALWNAVFRLDPSGTRMASQYWGVPTAPVRGTTASMSPPAAPPASLALRDTAAPVRAEPIPAPPASPRTSRAALLWRGIATVVPVWLLLLATAGFAAALAGAIAPGARGRLAWLLPPLAASLVPVVVAYVEPRSLLPLVPIAAIGASLLLAAAAGRLAPTLPAAWRAAALPAAVGVCAAALAAPAIRDGYQSISAERPLQQVSAARRAVAYLLEANLPADAIVASWHPAVGYFAGREWRVLPYEPLDRVLGYARAQGVSAIVLSRFDPSPLPDPEHSFQVLLLDPAAPAPDVRALRLATVQESPLVVVRRVLPSAGVR